MGYGDGYLAQAKLGMHGRDGRDTRSIPAVRKEIATRQ